MSEDLEIPDKVFCRECGKPIRAKAEICPACGVRQAQPIGSAPEGAKDWLTTLLIAIFLGAIGGHRFYTGSYGIGIVQLLTLGGCGIWTIIDIIMILTGSYRDKDGKPLYKK